MDRSQCPPMVTGQSPQALLVYVMVLCTAWCWLVSLTVNVVHLQVFFCGRKSFFVQLLLLAAGQPTCAIWWCCLSWGWLASLQAVECYTCVYGVLSTSHRPHIGCQIWVVVGWPLCLGGVAHALGPWQWTNNSTNLLWMKYVGKLYCQFSTWALQWAIQVWTKQALHQGEPMKAV